MKIYPHKIL